MDHTLRLYSNPLKQGLHLLISLVFVAIGVLMVRDPESKMATVILGYVCIAFFGLGLIVFPVSMAREFLLRRPVLQVDSQGWTFNPALGQRSQQASWQDI